MRKMALLLMASAVFAAEPGRIVTRGWTPSINPNPEENSPLPNGRSSYNLRYEVTFTPDAASDAEFYRITLEYTDLDGVAHKESRTAERAEKVTVIFLPRPFIFGTIKLIGFKESVSATMPVWNEAVRP